MQLSRRTLSAVLAAAISCGAAGLMSYSYFVDSPTAQAAAREKERHPHIRAALHELRESKKELEEADHDFGGHRVEALKAIDHAIHQLEKALKHDKE